MPVVAGRHHHEVDRAPARVVGHRVALAVAAGGGGAPAGVRERQRPLDRALDVEGDAPGAGVRPRAGDILRGEPERSAERPAARELAVRRQAALPVAQRRRGHAPVRDAPFELPARQAQAPDERIGGPRVVHQPGVAALARGDHRCGELAPDAEAPVAERQRHMHTLAGLQPGLPAIGDGDRDRAVRALLAHHGLVLADAEDEDPRADGVLAPIGRDRTGGAILLALAAAHDAQRAQQLMVDRLRDPRGVGGERHRPQDHRHEQQDADVVDAGLAANRRSWGALWGHPGTLAGIV